LTKNENFTPRNHKADRIFQVSFFRFLGLPTEFCQQMQQNGYFAGNKVKNEGDALGLSRPKAL
jgi:hypothetical protein